MNLLSRISWLAGCFVAAISAPVHGQLCFDIFEDLTDPSLSCADAFYFVDGPAPGNDDFSQFGDGRSGLLGAEFDGFDLFDPTDPERAPPDSLLEPFFSDIQYSQTNVAGQINSFQARHRGSVSMRARDSEFQSASYGSRSKITFIPFTTDGSTDPIILELEFDFELTARDPSDNVTRGGVTSAAGARIFNPENPLDTLFAYSGIFELDLDNNSSGPTLFGDFDGPAASFEPSGPGINDEFDLDVDFDTTFQVTPGERLTLDTDTFGSIFTDGFESGDTSAWSSSSGDTFVFTVSSSNPNVRFMFVVESSQDINYGHAGGWFNPLTSGQGFLFDFIPDSQFMFAPWFTFDTLASGKGGSIAGDELRWLTAQGNYSGNRADLTLFQTLGGVFDDPAPVTTQAVGTMVVEFQSCTSGRITYDLPDFGLSGVIPISKLLADEICSQIRDGEIVLPAKAAPPEPAKGNGQSVNYGLIGGWFNPATDGQGFMFDFLTASRQMFVAWFTADTGSAGKGGAIPGSDLRWLTAQGTYGTDNTVQLDLFQTLGGVFDDPAVPTTSSIGTLTVTFNSCTSATAQYNLPGPGLSGTIPLTKLLADEICTAINNGSIEVR